MFQAPQARDLYRNWAAVAVEHVSRLQVAAAACRDKAVDTVIEELLAVSPEFARIWGRYEVSAIGRSQNSMTHPVAGRLDFHLEVLILPDRCEQWVLIYIPADEATATTLDLLLHNNTTTPSGRPVHLHAV